MYWDAEEEDDIYCVDDVTERFAEVLRAKYEVEDLDELFDDYEDEEDSLERQCLDCDRTFMEDPINKEARWYSTKCGLCTGNTGLCDVCGTEVIWEDLIIDDDDDEMDKYCADCHKSSSNAVD